MHPTFDLTPTRARSFRQRWLKESGRTGRADPVVDQNVVRVPTLGPGVGGAMTTFVLLGEVLLQEQQHRPWYLDGACAAFAFRRLLDQGGSTARSTDGMEPAPNMKLARRYV